MRTRTMVEHIGENMGPIDWSHEYAKDMPPIWREAEKSPGDYKLNGRQVYEMGMYDGWPYWKPTPALFIASPLGGGTWEFFNAYGVHPSSLTRKDGP